MIPRRIDSIPKDKTRRIKNFMELTPMNSCQHEERTSCESSTPCRAHTYDKHITCTCPWQPMRGTRAAYATEEAAF